MISASVHIIDPTGELDGEALLVEVRCPEAEVYEKYFPHHVKAYESSCGGENPA